MAEKTLPAPIKDLRFLAQNLRWSWHAETRALFERLDAGLWNAAQHNPVLLLERLDPIYTDIISHDPKFCADIAAAAAKLRQYLDSRDTWYHKQNLPADLRVAYFSAEFAITEALPIFSGGLGVLAGDHLKSASDLGVPLVAVTLMYREGYFRQRIDDHGQQHERYDHADPGVLPVTLERDAQGEPIIVSFPILDHHGYAQIWRADIGRVPLYLLDTDIAYNRPENRRITDRLYGGDNEHRLRQEIVLGIGGMRALRALNIEPSVVHLNEGHAAFAAIEMMRAQLPPEHGALYAASRQLSQRVVFTTHTPVPAGHDMFATHLMERYLGGFVWEMREPWRRFLSLGRHDATDDDEPFNMTLLALRMSGRRNGVSKLHGEVSRKMWSGVWPGIPEEDAPIRHITNGVHLSTWVAPTMSELYHKYVGPEWAEVKSAHEFSGVSRIPADEIWKARGVQRRVLIRTARRVLAAQRVRRGESTDGIEDTLDPEALTIVFARRFATYKRATLLLSDPDRLIRLLRHHKIQFIFAGKAHPRDEPGKELLRQINQFGVQHKLRDRFVFLEDYEVALARDLVSGADVWLNVPRKPYEASGTSGMKAAANGALNLSIPDGWWAEAWTDLNRMEHPIGWSIDVPHVDGQDKADANELYSLLEKDVAPLFFQRDEHGRPADWIERIRASMLQNVPFFNTHRMVSDYTTQSYIPAHKTNGKSSSERIA